MRLLEHDVQAASPVKDTGNDLIAVRGRVFNAIQVKTTVGRGGPRDLIAFKLGSTMSRDFHIFALVFVVKHESIALLDRSAIYLLPKADVAKGRYRRDERDPYLLSGEHVDRLFPKPPVTLV